MSNLDLSLEFLKKCQRCRESGVPEDNAVLAALQDLADYKDKVFLEKATIFLEGQSIGFVDEKYPVYDVTVVDDFEKYMKEE